MNKFVDLTGQSFGERTVVRLSHQNEVSRNYYWVVTCSCGREDVVSGTRLRKGSKCMECAGRENGRKGLYSMSKGMPVYFIRCGEYVKVGASNNPEERLRDLLSCTPFDCFLVKVDTSLSEEEWHRLLGSCHHRGEWYHFKDVCEIVDIGT